MKNKVYNVCGVFLMLLMSSAAFAQGNNFEDEDGGTGGNVEGPDASIGKMAIWLGIAAIVIVFYYLKNMRTGKKV